ncbi:hypothetical protein KEM56_006206 [Ascosphaera pollenicola]|nr:hypothetical protein KEM56_006206 [Ascosphaera pollenicola]
MGALLSLVVDYATPIFLTLSPIISYSDQIMAIHRTKSSSGFSLDIPLIMLVASIFKIFYWFGARYATSARQPAAEQDQQNENERDEQT